MTTHALDDMTVFREYEPRELGSDDYPRVWHDLSLGHAPGVGVKDIVRVAAGERCQRCGHPYIPGCGTWTVKTEGARPAGLRNRALDIETQFMFEASDLIAGIEGARITDRDRAEKEDLWSPCDERCTHEGPFRTRVPLAATLAYGDSGWTTYGAHALNAGERVRSGLEVQAAWRILTVHHLNERKHDLRWWNLAALCQRCHLTIQRKVTMENPWPWEHSEWFRPHAAAWYALRYLGEHLTYSQTIARLDELLALGREQEQVERMAL